MGQSEIVVAGEIDQSPSTGHQRNTAAVFGEGIDRASEADQVLLLDRPESVLEQ
jgi:hypothetical protein